MSHDGRYTWRPEEGIKSTETEVIGGCELSHFTAGHQTLVWKRSKDSFPQSRLSSPYILDFFKGTKYVIHWIVFNKYKYFQNCILNVGLKEQNESLTLSFP